MKVTLIAKTDVEPRLLSSHAAKTCYTSTVPELGAEIDVQNRLFKPGHHTTLQHNYFTFNFDNIAVSSVVFGLHLASPFYNSDQRSGRFSKIYEKADITELEEYLRQSEYYSANDIDVVLPFIDKGIKIYHEYKSKLDEIALNVTKQERPFTSDDYLKQNTPKFAQEQLRMFISQIVPTSLDYTIDISALSALHRVAWNPEMRDAAKQMVTEVLKLHPDMAYMFEPQAASSLDWNPEFNFSSIELKEKPELEILNVKFDEAKFNDVSFATDTVDVSQFSPLCMDNSQMFVNNRVKISCATMGQDQRHRTIKRSAPEITSNFYLPPLLKLAGLEKIALAYMQEYVEICSKVSPMMATAIAPYGVVVEYEKTADINALMHEQGKRTCWCAQEEIYHLGTELRKQLAHKLGKDSPLLSKLAPHCFASGKCCEGVRYCGRDIKGTLLENYFKDRQI